MTISTIISSYFLLTKIEIKGRMLMVLVRNC